MINFFRFRTLNLLLSSALFVLFAGFAFMKYSQTGSVFTYSIDFTGGTQILLRSNNAFDAEKVTDIVESQGWQSPTVRKLSENEVIIRVQDFASDAQGLGERIRQAMVDQLQDDSIELLQSEAVGPGVGETLRWKSMMTVLLALLVLLVYIALRFWSFAYAAGAVFALFHDAVVILAVFFFLDRAISINVIGAILAVLGYSINDTIVIFSRIRENLKKSNDSMLLQDVVNESLNSTLRRTILTSVSTGLPVLVMLIFGGQALFDFSLALLTGVIFGTYSLIYIASPIMMVLHPNQ
jgi:preprotein translocase SecF subunit